MASRNTLPEGTDSIIAGAGVLGDDEDLDVTSGQVGEDALTGAVAGNAGKGAADATPGSYGTSGIGGGDIDASGGGTNGSGLAKDRPYERDTSGSNSTNAGLTAGGVTGTNQAGDDDSNSASSASLRQQANDKVLELRGQATDRARDYAEQGKARATEALDNVVRMISDAASQVDDKVGSEYGDYARRAGSTVEQFANTLRDKDVDALFADARELVRKSPGVAAAAAAVLGFALVRVIKAGLDPSAQGGSQSPKAG